MSPRYFAKFTGSPDQNANNWFHFTPSGYRSGTPEHKIHLVKLRAYLIIKKIFRIK